MKVIPFIYKDIDDFCANTYLLVDSNSDVVVIDPSKRYQGLVEYIKDNKLNLKAILLTHGHSDHTKGVDILVNAFNVPVYLGFFDLELLKDPRKNCSRMFFDDITINSKVDSVFDNQVLNILEEPIIVMETPYHTEGSVCYYLANSNILFSGDSLFYHGIGRYDLPNSVPSKRKESLSKILSLPESTKVYCGHGPFTTIKEERQLN